MAASETQQRDQRTPVGRLLAWVVILLGGLFLLTLGGTYNGIASATASIAGQVLAYAVLGGWSMLALLRPAWRPSTPLLGPIAAACAAYLLSFAFSQRPRLSLEPTMAGLAWALTAIFLTRLLAERWFRARVAVALTVFTGAVAFGYIAQVLLEWWEWWGLIGRLAVPPLRPSFAGLFLGSPNLIGTTLLLSGPLVVAFAWSRYRRRSIALVLAGAAVLATFLSGSRGAYLGIGAGMLVALLLAATRGGGLRGIARDMAARLRSRPILVFPVAAVALAAIVLTPSLIARFAQGGGTLRFDLWASALAIFAEHPLFGAGPGTWVQLKVAANPPGVPDLILPHAHDLYVQAAAELGVVGLGALSILAFAVGRRLWTGWRGADPAMSLESGAALVSFAAFAAQSVFDNLVNLPFVLLLLVVVLVWVDAGLTARDPAARASATNRSPVGRWHPPALNRALVPLAALASLAIVAPSLLSIDRAALQSRAGSDAASQGDWDTALGAFDEARTIDPGFTLYELQAASALGRVGRADEARRTLEAAVELDPVAINVIGLAALEAEAGDRDAALDHVTQARAFGVGDPNVALNAGLILEKLGYGSGAIEAFADAIAWDAALAGAGIWEGPERSRPKAEIVAAAMARSDPLEAALIQAYGGDPEGALAVLDTQTESSRRSAYQAVALWLGGRTDEALASLDAILQEDPGDWFVAAWAARIARLSDRPELGDRYAAWAIAVQGDAAPGYIFERSVVPADIDIDGATAGLSGSYDWAVYLRTTSPFLHQGALTLIGFR